MTRIRSAAGIDADGVAQTDADHWSTCSKCGERFDMRDLAQVFAHLHGAEVEITGGRRAAAAGRDRAEAASVGGLTSGPCGPVHAQARYIGRFGPQALPS